MTGRLLLVLIALAASGCTPFRQEFWTREQVGLHVIQGVPYRPQEQRDDCGPSALASLLAYRGRDVPVGEISRAVYEPKLGGSLLPDMENFARQ